MHYFLLVQGGELHLETLIKERQEKYYKVLDECDHDANSGKFIEFSLQAIYDTLKEIFETEQVNVQVTEQVEKLFSTLT